MRIISICSPVPGAGLAAYGKKKLNFATSSEKTTQGGKTPANHLVTAELVHRRGPEGRGPTEERQRRDPSGLRYRYIEGSSLLPSVDPLNELLLGLDFFADLREEGVLRPLPGDTSAEDPALADSLAPDDPREEGEARDNEDNCEADEEHGEAKETSQDVLIGQAQLSQQREYLRPIPTVIPNENVYIGFFLPLFLQEAKQALARAIKLDLGPPEQFLQQSGEPRGSFLSLLLSRSGGVTAVSASACRYCHGDLVLMYIPRDRAADEAKRHKTTDKGGEREAQGEKSGEKETNSKEASGGQPDEEAEVRPATRVLRPHDTDCHVLAVVSQGQHEAISVKVLTPLGPAYNGKDIHGVEEGQNASGVYNPATGRPYGFLLPRDRRRLLKLVKALNGQFTKWTVQRIMSLTTIHREFQGLMSLPDLLLKDSLFRVPTEGSSPRQPLSKDKPSSPLNNPLLEGQEVSQSATESGGATVSPPAGNTASGEGPSPSDGPRAQTQTSLASTSDEASEKASERKTQEKTQQAERRLVIPEALKARLESLYNASQLSALEDSLKVEGVTLIQGPPGTGKTSTIVGVVSVILHAQVEGQHEEHARSSSNEHGGTTEGKADRQETKQGTADQANYTPWMDEEELTLEDLDCHVMLQPAAIPTDTPICLTRERHELQPVYVHIPMQTMRTESLSVVTSSAAVSCSCQGLFTRFCLGGSASMFELLQGMRGNGLTVTA
ncbi:uncharacterized protein EMH_0003040 [Eimeria mitis]|uniref:DNA2/NAM7 helicase helicase domain-containing protein n=1 Tax=Eimeria mitis TaxID=44415 RepID=U6JUG3_9EIME|nr:uncharacterized protein EMH_0003040 [Eimeria mitis]CDJ29110.1 hypothetical protein EMH_0003040 [Eimeria mitis]